MNDLPGSTPAAIEKRPLPGDVPVLAYGVRTDEARGHRRAIVAFLWSLLCPVAVAGAMYFMVEGVIGIDDLLPRNAALAVIGVVGVGIPFSAVLFGTWAAVRAPTVGQRWLCIGAIVLACGWCLAAVTLLLMVIND